MGYQIVDYLVEDLTRLSESRVARPHRQHDYEHLLEPLPRQASPFDEVLDQFDRRIVPGLTRVHHPRFHAYVPAPGSYVGALGTFLGAGLNSFVGSWLGGGSMSQLELVVLDWLAELVGYPKAGSGLLTSGGSIANLVGIACGRARAGRPVELGVVYVSAQAHASCSKAAVTLGIRPENVRVVPCGSDFRMLPESLRKTLDQDRRAGLHPVAVCANAGTTNTGTIDPLDTIADICRDSEAWFHVDGAYGGFAAADPHTQPAFSGMERADSLALDPHKWLYAPMGTGCVLFREEGSAERAFQADGDYLRDALALSSNNFFDRGPELSRPARAVAVWLTLKTYGAERIVDEIREDLRLARLAGDLLTEDDALELVAAPELSVLAFRFREDPTGARTEQLMNSTLEQGEVMISTTELNGAPALRFVVMNHRTDEDELRRSVDTIHRTVRRILDAERGATPGGPT